jgi:putative hydrolase of the HAD superfamily
MTTLIIFDGDDTLWRSEHLYDEARRRAAEVVAGEGLDPVRWEELQHQIDIANVATLGLSRLRFPASSVAAYRATVHEAGLLADARVETRVRTASEWVFAQRAPLMPHARHVLLGLRTTHRLALLTQGDAVVQQKRIEDSGLDSMFEVISVVERKTEATFAAVAAEVGVSARDTWSVGNSIPSDINPALRLGMAAIWIEAHVWAHERREALHEPGRFLSCGSLSDVPRLISRHTLVS